MISRSVLICAKFSAEMSVSYLPFDICRAGIYRHQRNSCRSQCTRAISSADHPVRKLLSRDRLEHRRRNQCTQWDRCIVEALHRTSGGHRHRCGLSPDGYNHRAYIYTGGILGSDAGFGDDVGHRSAPCMDRISLKKHSSCCV